MSARGFAKVDGLGNLIASEGVVGMKPAVHSSGSGDVSCGAYCFKVSVFTPNERDCQFDCAPQ